MRYDYLSINYTEQNLWWLKLYSHCHFTLQHINIPDWIAIHIVSGKVWCLLVLVLLTQVILGSNISFWLAPWTEQMLNDIHQLITHNYTHILLWWWSIESPVPSIHEWNSKLLNFHKLSRLCLLCAKRIHFHLVILFDANSSADTKRRSKIVHQDKSYHMKSCICGF